MKKLIVLIMTMLLVVGMCACGQKDAELEDAQMKSTVDSFMTAIKEQDKDGMKAVYAEKIDFPDMMMGDGYEECSKALYDKIFDYDYVIVDENVSEDTASVDIKIDTYLLDEMYLKWMEDVTLDPSIFEGMDEKEQTAKMADMFMDRVNEYDAKDYTETVTLDFVKSGDTWVIEDADCVEAFVKAIYAGLIQD